MATQVLTVTPSAEDILPFPALEATLANGLRVIILATGFPNIVSLQIPVQTGSRNEVEPGKSGFAHFFEHMMFRGTERYPAHAYQAIVTRAGARQNAYTTDDYTNYHMTFAAEDLEKVLEIEADRFMNLQYSEADFRTEARAILGEYNKSSSEPMAKLIEVQREHAFSTHTYQHTTMGFIRDIEDMPNQFDYSRTFFDRWYRPEYTAVIIAGDVEPNATLALVEKHFGAWQRGSFAVEIPQEPPSEAPLSVHHTWPAATLPLLTVAFRGPAFSTTNREFVALDALLDISFGETSDLYRRLVEQEQKVDQFGPYFGQNEDPALATIIARVKDPADAREVRDLILAELARAAREPVDPKRLADVKSFNRYAFARTLDNSESIAATLARYVRHDRRYDTLNALYRAVAELTPADLEAVAKHYISEANLVQATLAGEAIPGLDGALPALPGPTAATGQSGVPLIRQTSPSTLLRFKLAFVAGSAYDPVGKEGLAGLAASMVSEAGSASRRIDEITRALFPIAGSFEARVDKELTTFTGVIHRDNLDAFADIVFEQLTQPGFREIDFTRLKDEQRNALVQDLRTNNDEELGKERLQTNVFTGNAYGHPVLGTVEGIDAITLDDVRDSVLKMFTRANLWAGIAGDVPLGFEQRLQRELAKLPAGVASAVPSIHDITVPGINIEIIEKETRATAISFGHPIRVTRKHEDFAALWLARSWLGEHRASQGRLFQQLREVRGLNYGNYAYIEAFPRAMYGFFPDTNLVRRVQLFEVWIRPVPPEQAVFAFKAGLHEVDGLIRRGLSADEFETTREYLLKNVFLLTKTQDQQLGSAIDSAWYGIGDFVTTMRKRLADLTLGSVNAAIRRHLSAENLQAVFVTKDGASLRDELLSGAFTSIDYAGAEKSAEVLAEDQQIGARSLGLTAERIRITPIGQVFA